VAAGCFLYYLAGGVGYGGAHASVPAFQLHPAFPIPTFGFIHGFDKAISYMPIAFPFALLTIIGGINNTESARVAGDAYRTRDILLTEAFATVVAALFGGVAQTTPYIGHPAYKSMGGRAAYTLATGLFVGIGGALGIMSFVVEAIPEAVITPVLLFVGIEILSQAFAESPRRHAPAVAFAIVPTVGYLVLTYAESLIGKLAAPAAIPAAVTADLAILRAVGHGFILTAILWGAFLSDLIDNKMRRAAAGMFFCAVFTMFGFIHSVVPSGAIYFPWKPGTGFIWQIALGYGLVGFALLCASFRKDAMC